MRSQKPTPLCESRAGEQGAALITALLLSLLLLAAGGTLILTSTMTSLTARDSTAEMQAYYAAEAGIARSLEVLRGNVQSNPAGTRASFHNVVCTRTLWTTISGNTVNVTADGSSQFRVTSVRDPEKQDSEFATLCATASYKPDRLQIRVTGTGTRGSLKKMEIIVSRYTLEYDVNAVVTLPNGSGDLMAFALGGSNVTTTSGMDGPGCGGGAEIAAFAVSNNDYNAANNVIDGCHADGSNCGGSAPNVTPGNPAILTGSNTPSFLQSVTNARQFLYGSEGMMNAAINQGRYFNSGTAAINSTAGLGASNPDGVLTFVDGDLVLGPGDPTGQGTLIVTGNLTLSGNFNFNGVIMVLGEGHVLRNGGGSGFINGAMFVAKFARTGADTDVIQAPTFDTNGGGSATIQYCSNAIDKAKSVGGHAVRAIREY